MFTAFRKVFDYLWNGDEVYAEDEEVMLELQEPENNSGKKTKTGKVSHIYSGHGLIDGEIYFSFDIVLGGYRPTVGDVVNVVSQQTHEDGGWQAVQVQVISDDWISVSDSPVINLLDPDWPGSSVDPAPIKEKEGIEPSSNTESIIGKISVISDKSGFINDVIPFSIDSCLDGFQPVKGDWVKVDVTRTGLDFEKTISEVKNIAPLRTLQFEGEITAVREDHGFIDANVDTSIFYYSNVFSGQCFLQKRDSVKGLAVESTQGNCVWRAISITQVFNPFPCERVLNTFDGSANDPRYLQDLLKNKHGIHVSGDVYFGDLTAGEVKVQTVWIQNNGTLPQSLLGCEVWGQSSIFSVQSIKFMFEHAQKISTNEKRRNVDLLPNETAVLYPAMGVYVNVTCTPRFIGSEYQLLVLQFEGFCIGRRLSVSVRDPHQVHVEVSDSYRGNQRSQAFSRSRSGRNNGWVVPGQKPSNKFRQSFPQRLSQYPVSEELENCVYQSEDLFKIYPQLNQPLEMCIYGRKFHTLLHLEEIQMDIDIREFDLERVGLRRCGEYLSLGVPGLAEGRPSVLIGDKVTLSDPGEVDGLKYEGYVHEVLSEDILLKFHDSFHQKYNSEDYDVVFSYNRSTLRRCHQAVDLGLQLGESVLFPNCVCPKLPQWVPGYSRSVCKTKNPSEPCDDYGKAEESSMAFINTKLNNRQREAVVRIVLGQGRPTPYILFGPPGTGKTVTLVESILQIFLHCTHSRVLACTPSNSAADLLAERLHQSGKLSTSDMVRINALQRSQENVPECVRPYCYSDESLSLVSQYRIIVCTCSSAGMLLSMGLRVGHITHVFVDEAGQATEPECLIPASLVGGTDGQIVLAGDPYQLGPVLNSRYAKTYGLELSWLERLTMRPVYQRDMTKYGNMGGYNPLLVTKLVDNYRSHKALLTLPSRLFYDDELSVKADLMRTHPYSGWPHLPTVGFPIIFHGVRGEDLREGNSPSWFNPMEAVQVVKYLQMLLNDESYEISPEEIGIITAYRKQVEKIRLLMEKLGMPSLKVGSVEEFQGQERKVIIISTVRSTEKLVGFDVRHHLGFLSNPKRFNVSITRAQALLIIVGNPYVLAQDPYWHSLIEYSSTNGAYTGCDLPDLELIKSMNEDFMTG